MASDELSKFGHYCRHEGVPNDMVSLSLEFARYFHRVPTEEDVDQICWMLGMERDNQSERTMFVKLVKKHLGKD